MKKEAMLIFSYILIKNHQSNYKSNKIKSNFIFIQTNQIKWIYNDEKLKK